MRQPRYGKEDFARHSNRIYEQKVRHQVERGNRSKIVAIDIETGAFEVADNTITAANRLLAHHPDSQT